MTDDGSAALADDHTAGFLNQDTIALAYLVAGTAYVIKTPRVVLRRGWHEGALGPRGRRIRRRRLRLQGGRRNRGRSDRLLRRGGSRRLAGRTGNAALLTWLHSWLLLCSWRRSDGRLAAGRRRRLDLLLPRRRLHLALLRSWRLPFL
jgi:hypothetical protein